MLVVIPCDAVLLVVETVTTFAIDLVSSLALVFDSQGSSAEADMLAVGGERGPKSGSRRLRRRRRRRRRGG